MSCFLFRGDSSEHPGGTHPNLDNITPVLQFCSTAQVKVCSYIAQYPVLGTVQSTLHFTWQTRGVVNRYSGSYAKLPIYRNALGAVP